MLHFASSFYWHYNLIRLIAIECFCALFRLVSCGIEIITIHLMHFMLVEGAFYWSTGRRGMVDVARISPQVEVDWGDWHAAFPITASFRVNFQLPKSHPTRTLLTVNTQKCNKIIQYTVFNAKHMYRMKINWILIELRIELYLHAFAIPIWIHRRRCAELECMQLFTLSDEMN